MKTLSSLSPSMWIRVPQESHLLRTRMPRNQVAVLLSTPTADAAAARSLGEASIRGAASGLCPIPLAPPSGGMDAKIAPCLLAKLCSSFLQKRVGFRFIAQKRGKVKKKLSGVSMSTGRRAFSVPHPGLHFCALISGAEPFCARLAVLLFLAFVFFYRGKKTGGTIGSGPQSTKSRSHGARPSPTLSLPG